MEGPLAHASPIVATYDIIVRLSPAECLCGCENCSLDSLAIVAYFSVLAPARFILALMAVVWAIRCIIIHLEHVVKATRVRLSWHLSSGSLRNSLISTEVIDVRILLAEFELKRSNLCYGWGLCLSSFFLKMEKFKINSITVKSSFIHIEVYFQRVMIP